MLNMICVLFTILLASCSTFVSAFVQGDCVNGDHALTNLASKLSHGAAISCRGSPLQLQNAGRYWGEQYGKNATVVVYPRTSKDVSLAVVAAAESPQGADFAFVSGAHGQTNASSTCGFLIDLSWMNSTSVVHNVKISDTKIDTAIAYQGGATWDGVNNATAGSGYIAVGARVGSVGVGGFSTGGGIGFAAGAYGYATDRLVAMEIVLLSGEIVYATKTNRYADLFWALQGGGGQFGIVTRFWQKAALEPKKCQVGVWVVDKSTMAEMQSNTVDFFDNNQDPFSLMYYGVGFVPAKLTTGSLGAQLLLVGVWMEKTSGNTAQKSFNETFAALISGLNTTSYEYYDVPYTALTEVIDPFFPYGYRRGFYGPQTTKITTEYLAQASNELFKDISTLVAKADYPVTGLWALQYMFPGLNGNLPTSDAATGWPHSVAGHQTLFSPAWSEATDDGIPFADNQVLNQITWDQQAKVGRTIPDYPNYISPDVPGPRVWGDNVGRLIQVKAKYDPFCRIHNGRVFATHACIAGGWANVYP